MTKTTLFYEKFKQIHVFILSEEYCVLYLSEIDSFQNILEPFSFLTDWKLVFVKCWIYLRCIFIFYLPFIQFKGKPILPKMCGMTCTFPLYFCRFIFSFVFTCSSTLSWTWICLSYIFLSCTYIFMVIFLSWLFFFFCVFLSNIMFVAFAGGFETLIDHQGYNCQKEQMSTSYELNVVILNKNSNIHIYINLMLNNVVALWFWRGHNIFHIIIDK